MAFLSQLIMNQSATGTITKLVSHIATNTTNVRLIVSLPTTYLLHERNSNQHNWALGTHFGNPNW